MIISLTLISIQIMAFAFGWMLVEFIKSWFGFKVDWLTQWLKAILAGMIFAFLMYLIK